MSKLAILKIGAGNFHIGFQATLRIESDGICIAEIDGQLPPAPQIPEQYSEWRANYSDQGLGFRVLEAVEGQNTNISVVTLSDNLKDSLNQWLNYLGREFQPIREGLLSNLKITDKILFVIKPQNELLLRLPWQICDLFERYPNGEVVISNPCQAVANPDKKLKDQVRILVILGVNSDINVQADLEILKENLPDAEIVPLIATSRDKLGDRLWEQEWDILFFAGHSCSEFGKGQGKFYINEHESIAIEDLKYDLRNAIKNGLKLAIFNSCDGLGLAQGLADLHMPAIVVMRERIPDGAAQKFLEYFLQAFAVKGMSLPASVREARERLHGLENIYPCASWLPVLYQHANADPLTWMGLREILEPDIQEQLPVFDRLVNHAIEHKVKMVMLILLGAIGYLVLPPMTSDALNRMGVAKIQAHQFARAKSYLNLALKLNPNNSSARNNLGRLEKAEQEDRSACDKFREAKKQGNAAGWNNEAYCEIKDGNYERAESLLRRGLTQATSKETQYAILKNLGWVLLETGAYDEADAKLQDAIARIGDRAPARCLLAQVLEAKGDQARALSEWDYCLRYASLSIEEEKEWIFMARERIESAREK